MASPSPAPSILIALRSSKTSPSAGGHAPASERKRLSRRFAKSSTTKTKVRRHSSPTCVRATMTSRASASATRGWARTLPSKSGPTAWPISSVALAGRVPR
jgi:hypothetical protein